MEPVIAVVQAALQSYADRGIFQNFAVATPAAGGVTEFRFNWLTESPFLLRLNAGRGELELRDVLPAVPHRSDMDRDFRQFIRGRSLATVPAHRRVDDQRFAVTCRNRGGKLSLLLIFDKEDGAEAAKLAINLLHEVFNNFLMEGPYQNYMVEVFNVPEE